MEVLLEGDLEGRRVDNGPVTRRRPFIRHIQVLSGRPIRSPDAKYSVPAGTGARRRGDLHGICTRAVSKPAHLVR